MTKSSLIKILFFFASLALIVPACSVKYSLTEGSIPPEVKTYSVQPFQNYASMVVPSLASTLTEALQDKFTKLTRLTPVREDGDYAFEGDITNYTSSPIAVTGDEYASMNRLTITVSVRFTNKISPERSFNQSFSAYGDYDSNKLLQEVEPSLLPEIIEKLVDDIFNRATSNW